MNAILFISTLVFSISVVAIAMLHLRHATRQVISEVCHSDAAAEFWLRSADILAFSGSIMLVLIFGNTTTTEDWMEAIRTTLILTLSGLFITVFFVAQNVWRSVVPTAKTNQPLSKSLSQSGSERDSIRDVQFNSRGAAT
jgi:drug/metabolite transporter (DMT)-like permease